MITIIVERVTGALAARLMNDPVHGITTAVRTEYGYTVTGSYPDQLGAASLLLVIHEAQCDGAWPTYRRSLRHIKKMARRLRSVEDTDLPPPLREYVEQGVPAWLTNGDPR